MRFGSGMEQKTGVVIVLTFGTGIGSAMFVDGHLLPNTEFGELEIDGEPAEARASGQLRRQGHLGWDEWIARVQRVLTHVELLFSPDLIILGEESAPNLGGFSIGSRRNLNCSQLS